MSQWNLESNWNFNVKEAPKCRSVWLSIERDDGKVYVVLDRVAWWGDRAYAWMPYETPKPAPSTEAQRAAHVKKRK